MFRLVASLFFYFICSLQSNFVYSRDFYIRSGSCEIRSTRGGCLDSSKSRNSNSGSRSGNHNSGNRANSGHKSNPTPSKPNPPPSKPNPPSSKPNPPPHSNPANIPRPTNNQNSRSYQNSGSHRHSFYSSVSEQEMRESTELTRRHRLEGEERERKAREEIAKKMAQDDLDILALKGKDPIPQTMDDATYQALLKDAKEKLEKSRAEMEARRKERLAFKATEPVPENTEDNAPLLYSREDIPQFRELVEEAKNSVNNQDTDPYKPSLVEMGESSVNLADNFFSTGEDKEANDALTFAKSVLNLALGLIPTTSFGKDLYEAWTGVQAFSSEKLSIEDHGIAILGALTFGLGGKILKTTKFVFRLFNRGKESTKALFFVKKVSDSSKDVTRVRWGAWVDLSKVKENGIEYAQIGSRRYTHHAIDRMAPTGLGKAMSGLSGRGVPTMVVESTIEIGKKVNTQTMPSGAIRETWMMGTVQVVTENNKELVITVMRVGG